MSRNIRYSTAQSCLPSNILPDLRPDVGIKPPDLRIFFALPQMGVDVQGRANIGVPYHPLRYLGIDTCLMTERNEGMP